MEPNVEVEKALYLPSTGIIEPDELMNHFYTRMRRNNAVLATETELKSLKKVDNGYELEGVSMGEKFHVTAKTVVNCAGLYSTELQPWRSWTWTRLATGFSRVRETISGWLENLLSRCLFIRFPRSPA